MNETRKAARSRRARLLVGALALASTAVWMGPVPAVADHDPGSCAAIGAPSYYAPGPDWDRAVAAGSDVRYLILNPNSGPGAEPDPFHVERARQAHGAGIRVLGYVSTAWGMRSDADVRAEVVRYQEWYGVTSIFFDEAATEPELLSWYGELAAAVRVTPGAVVAMNPGTVPDPGYAAVADVLVVFEGPWSRYRTATVPAWVHDHPATRFWHLVYGTPKTALRPALDRVAELNAATLYVTDDALPNPWDRLPTYWDRELRELSRAQVAACQS